MRSSGISDVRGDRVSENADMPSIVTHGTGRPANPAGSYWFVQSGMTTSGSPASEAVRQILFSEIWLPREGMACTESDYSEQC